MAISSTTGGWLQDSGWTAVINAAKVTTDGRADNLLRELITARTQWTHQVSAAALHPYNKC